MFKLVIIGTICALSVAAQQLPKWGIEQGVMGAMGTSVTFTNSTRGFYPLNQNGGGSDVLMTNDGGETWAPTGSV